MGGITKPTYDIPGNVKEVIDIPITNTVKI